MFRTLVGLVRAVDHLVANERRRYAGRTVVALPVILLTGVDRGLANDTDSLLRLTIMDSPSEEMRRNQSSTRHRSRDERVSKRASERFLPVEVALS